eukprot:TRINITY_DN3116_c0_g1_i9.p1 TRINITY_DN3116_c0_g1~~TRINITY_DN3116_c0_g1_i9.p1  ORF type:complete len:762 (-),score=169.38 TRINITY_DN3116_c0_g1_i9:277-2562(-)
MLHSYVVYLGGQHENLDPHVLADYHHELLAPVLGSKDDAKDAIFYSYTRGLNGFAAHLQEDHAFALSGLPEVVSVFLNQGRKLHTTHSWEFLGLEKSAEGSVIDAISEPSLWDKANFGREVIIANLDSGVWPESASFHDVDLGPVPLRWRGYCDNGTEFGPAQCNRKLIGARHFIKGYEAINGPLNLSDSEGKFHSPRDATGHGTHTLSTAGGSFVRNASVYGFGEGIAKGGAPHARVVAYKVCWPPDAQGAQCYDADILAAFDAGIDEGVDVFSISLGYSVPLADYFADGIPIGSFHAIQRGKVVVCSAGNDGPTPGTVTNVAPWVLTVAASSMDREFPCMVSLGNNKRYIGQSVSKFRLRKKKMYPLVSSVDVKAPSANETAGRFCLVGALDPKKVKGKIVVCLRGINGRVEKGLAVYVAGGAGMILCNPPDKGNEVVADSHFLPATHLNAEDGQSVFNYINSTRHPVAYVSSPSTQLNSKPAPVMTSFSSQGPNSLTPDILKPDITAPGLNVLAAFSRATSPTGTSFDKRHVDFNIVSGTSVACPHVSGVAALLKAAHPTWSPASIKSAIMTTATRVDNNNEAILNSSHLTADPFNYGSGHVNPNKAYSPGLVYDLSYKDYIHFFCSLEYDPTQIKAITGKDFTCPTEKPHVHDFNYPAITVADLNGSIILERTVTNVEKGQAVYDAKVQSPSGVLVSVEPTQLNFSSVWQKKSFKVAMKALNSSQGNYVFGSLTWQSSKHVVVSPIVVNVTAVKDPY